MSFKFNKGQSSSYRKCIPSVPEAPTILCAQWLASLKIKNGEPFLGHHRLENVPIKLEMKEFLQLISLIVNAKAVTMVVFRSFL